MPSPPYAAALAAVNAGAAAAGARVVVSGDVIQLSAVSTSHWTSCRWTMYGMPPSYPAPASWSTDADGNHYSTSFTPPPFTISNPATRWATTKLKDLGTSFKKYPQLERKVGADPMEFQKKLNIYGAGWDDKWWRKTFGDEKNDKSNILKHVAEIEKQIPNIEILSTRLKDALKEMNGG